MQKRFKIFFLGILVLFTTPSIVGADYLGQRNSFYVEPIYDISQRNRIETVLIYIGSNLYFYLDNEWWNPLDYAQQQKVREILASLDKEFTDKIYPTLTSNFGQEWKPGIDRDERITVLIHSMVNEAGGYYRAGDEYQKLQFPSSNEREMVYLNSKYLDNSLIKGFLAHEFTHLITFNQKERIQGVQEEVWLSEARSEYAPTLLGYDEVYEESNLQRRVKTFLERPNDSLTEWQGRSYDYGVLNIFTQYLVDHYGIKILTDSLKSTKIGIPSINEVLAQNGFKEDFSQIFTNWLITVYLNDCSIDIKYCYKTPNLKSFFLIPSSNFLPLIGESILTISDSTKDWAGNWYKFIGGQETLKIEFTGDSTVSFKIPYILEDISGKREVYIFPINNYQKGQIYISDFNNKIKSIVIIPSIQAITSKYNGLNPSHQLSLTASTVKKTPGQEAEEIKKLLEQITFLKTEIARVQAQINAILGQKTQEIPSNFRFEKNLYYGMTNSDVVYLKNILEKEGLLKDIQRTEWFGPKTKEAVIGFQKKYKNEISNLTGYQISCSGFVGQGTRAKLNQLIK